MSVRLSTLLVQTSFVFLSGFRNGFAPRPERGLGRRRGFASTGAIALMVLVGAALVIPRAHANDTVLVAAADELWRQDLRAALEELREGRTGRGIELLQRLLVRGDGALLEIRSEAVLESPLTAEIDATILVTEKRVDPAPRVRPRSRFAVRSPVRVKRTSTSKPRRFLSVPAVVRTVLRALPAEHRELYRARYDTRADALLASFRSSGSSAPLERLVGTYPIASSFAVAAEALGDVRWEEGRTLGAARNWRSAIESLTDDAASGGDAPERATRRARLRGKLARALVALGYTRAAEEAVAELEETGWPGAGVIAASPRTEALGVEIGAADPTPGAASVPADTDWSGALAQLFVGVGAGRGAPSLPSIEKGTFELSWASARALRLRGGEFAGLVPPVPFLPLVEGGELFLATPRWIHRFEASPGRGRVTARYRKPDRPLIFELDNETRRLTVKRWRERDGGPYANELPRSIIVSSFVDDVVEYAEYQHYQIRAEIPIRGLIAFDGETGEELWRTRERADRDRAVHRRSAASVLAARDERRGGRGAGEKGFSYTSPVLIRHGLVVVGGWVQRGYVNAALRGLDLRDGSVVWETLLSSSQLEQTMFGEIAREPFPGSIAEREGIVYFATQLGSVAAVELATGDPLWLTTYPTIPVESTLGPLPRLRAVRWGDAPLVFVDHLLLVAPRDGTRLYAIDTGSGADGVAAAGTIRWEFSGADFGSRLDHFVGYRDGYAYISSEEGAAPIVRLDIRERDARGRLVAEGGGVRREPAAEQTMAILGIHPTTHAVLTDRGLLVVSESRLRLVSFDLRSVVDLSAELPLFAVDEGRGRLDVESGSIYFTNWRGVTAFASRLASAGDRSIERRDSEAAGEDEFEPRETESD